MPSLAAKEIDITIMRKTASYRVSTLAQFRQEDEGGHWLRFANNQEDNFWKFAFDFVCNYGMCLVQENDSLELKMGLQVNM